MCEPKVEAAQRKAKAAIPRLAKRPFKIDS